MASGGDAVNVWIELRGAMEIAYIKGAVPFIAESSLIPSKGKQCFMNGKMRKHLN